MKISKYLKSSCKMNQYQQQVHSTSSRVVSNVEFSLRTSNQSIYSNLITSKPKMNTMPKQKSVNSQIKPVNVSSDNKGVYCNGVECFVL